MGVHTQLTTKLLGDGEGERTLAVLMPPTLAPRMTNPPVPEGGVPALPAPVTVTATRSKAKHWLTREKRTKLAKVFGQFVPWVHRSSKFCLLCLFICITLSTTLLIFSPSRFHTFLKDLPGVFHKKTALGKVAEDLMKDIGSGEVWMSRDHCVHTRQLPGPDQKKVVHDFKNKWSAVVDEKQKHCLLFYMVGPQVCRDDYPYIMDSAYGVLGTENTVEGVSLFRLLSTYPVTSLDCTGPAVRSACQNLPSFVVYNTVIKYSYNLLNVPHQRARRHTGTQGHRGIEGDDGKEGDDTLHLDIKGPKGNDPHPTEESDHESPKHGIGHVLSDQIVNAEEGLKRTEDKIKNTASNLHGEVMDKLETLRQVATDEVEKMKKKIVNADNFHDILQIIAQPLITAHEMAKSASLRSQLLRRAVPTVMEAASAASPDVIEKKVRDVGQPVMDAASEAGTVVENINIVKEIAKPLKDLIRPVINRVSQTYNNAAHDVNKVKSEVIGTLLTKGPAVVEEIQTGLQNPHFQKAIDILKNLNILSKKPNTDIDREDIVDNIHESGKPIVESLPVALNHVKSALPLLMNHALKNVLLSRDTENHVPMPVDFENWQAQHVPNNDVGLIEWDKVLQHHAANWIPQIPGNEEQLRSGKVEPAHMAEAISQMLMHPATHGVASAVSNLAQVGKMSDDGPTQSFNLEEVFKSNNPPEIDLENFPKKLEHMAKHWVQEVTGGLTLPVKPVT